MQAARSPLTSLARTVLLAIIPFATAHAQPGSITVGALARTYVLRLPSAYDGTTPLPLVICMHGGFGSGAQVETQSGLTPKAEAEGFIVVYPDGTQGGALNIRTWNAGWCCGASVTGNVDDVGFISALIDTLAARYAIDTARVYATGMSNGGFMSYRLACELSHRIAAIAPVAASMGMRTCAPTRPVPVIAFHSYLDANVPYLGGQGSGVSNHHNSPQDSVMAAWAALDACTVLNDTVVDDASLTHVRWRGCACGYEVQHYMTRDGGHSWPGGQGTGVGDPPSTAISANDLMWGFFQRFSLECPITTGQAPGGAPVERVRAYPNPAEGMVHFAGEGITAITIVNGLGRTVHQEAMPPSGRVTMDLRALSGGLYHARVAGRGGELGTVRFVLH